MPCNADKAAVHLVSPERAFAEDHEKRGPEVVIANVTVFRAIVESQSRAQKLSYGYDPVNLFLRRLGDRTLNICDQVMLRRRSLRVVHKHGCRARRGAAKKRDTVRTSVTRVSPPSGLRYERSITYNISLQDQESSRPGDS